MTRPNKDRDTTAPPSISSDELSALVQQADNLAAAAARVCAEYDGIHRLRAALSKWYDLRAGIYGTQGIDLVATSSTPTDGQSNPPLLPTNRKE